MKLGRICVAAVIVSASLTGAGLAVADSGEPPRPPWQGPDLRLDESKAPEWIAVLDGTGAVAGYARWSDLYAVPQNHPEDPSPEPPVKVYAEKSNRTHVGWVVPGRGLHKGVDKPR